MKKIGTFLILSSLILLLSCTNNENDAHDHGAKTEGKSPADSLMDEVNDDHIAGMAKMGKLTRAEQATRRLLDSISKLPAKAKKAAEPLRTKLDSLQKELSYAETAMNKWMAEMKWDSTFADVQGKIDYLAEEKVKVTKVKEYILNGIQKADSLVKQNY